MAFIQTAIIALIAFSFSIGQIFRPTLFGFSFPIIDIAIIIFTLWNLFYHLKNKDLKNQNIHFTIFLIYIWCLLGLTTIFTQLFFLKSLFYLIRLTCLLSLLIFPPKLNPKQKQLFNLGLIANIIFGFIQYFVWPNFTYFDVNQWDPHLYRLVSSFFDPTFTGLIYLLFFIKIFLDKKIPYRWPLLIFIYIALSLTYSRSTYLSLIIAFGFISFKNKNIQLFLKISILVLATIFVLPRQAGEGTKLERTSSITAKIENYQQGISLFKEKPIFGIGYNNLPLINKNENRLSHANGGFDSSLLTIFITTGIIGGTFFVLGLKQLLQQSDLTKKTCLIAILVHSLFANSLLYPWVLLFIAFI